MKVTIYELLGLMLKRQAPKKIEVLGFRLNFIPNAHWGDYEDENGYRLSEFRINECLNDTVEILEEEKKIPEKLELIKNGDFVEIPDSKDLMNKINEIIDYLKSKGE